MKGSKTKEAQEDKRPYWPKTKAELEAEGYSYERSHTCRGKDCKRTIEFWRSKNNKLVPLTRADIGLYQPHWQDCPNADDFRKAKAAGA